MLVRYRIPLTGELRIEFSFPIKTQSFIYEFEVNEDGTPTHLNAKIQVNDRSLWPQITKNPEPGIKAHIQLKSPFFPILQNDLRAASGMLSLFGLYEIKLDDIEEFWEPENSEEKEAIQILSFKRNKELKHPSEWQTIPFDLIARSLLAAEHASPFEVALNFFRKGRLDVQSEQYLDAVLDFLFMIETTYANGKIKTAQVEAEYLNSKELIDHIEKQIHDPYIAREVSRHGRMLQDFNQKYKGKTARDLIPYLVNLRGELHHHSSRKRGIWHPTDHMRFAADAIFLQHLCLDISFSIAEPTLFSKETIDSYNAQAKISAASAILKIHKK